MRKIKKRLFGYSPHEVDAYLAELDQQHQEMVQKRILPIILAWFLRKVIENPCVL